MSIFKRFADKRQQRLNQKRQELFLNVRDIVVKLLKIQDIEKIKPDTRFKEDLNIDSLDALELIMELESFFGFEIPDEDAEKLFTILDIVDYLEKRL
ncbi:TPA: acyl carrier protein [Candidatus Bathyarchaeota archaeon]|nr:acyl carrier protein [Candidatus Bathyarchaeota archaeon]